MRNITALLLLLAAAACSSTNQQAPRTAAAAPAGPGATVTLTEADRVAVETAVRARLGLPGATFRTMIGQREAGNAVLVCGYVNPGTGDTPFVGTLGGGSFTITDVGGTTERTIAVQNACHGRGIYI